MENFQQESTLKRVAQICLTAFVCFIAKAQTPSPAGVYGTATYYPFPQVTSLSFDGYANGMGVGPIGYPINGLSQYYITSQPETPYATTYPAGAYEARYYNSAGDLASYTNEVIFNGTSPTSIEGPSFLPPGITGKLVDTNGKPLAGYHFNLILDYYGNFPAIDEYTTDSNGVFLVYYTSYNSGVAYYSSYNSGDVHWLTFVPPGTYEFQNVATCTVLGNGAGTGFFNYSPGTNASSPVTYYTLRLDLGVITVSNNAASGAPIDNDCNSGY